MLKGMQTDRVPAIVKVVQHNDGPTALSRKLGGKPPYQEVQRWVSRGWAASRHLFRLEGLLPEGVTLKDLADDRDAAKALEQEATHG